MSGRLGESSSIRFGARVIGDDMALAVKRGQSHKVFCELLSIHMSRDSKKNYRDFDDRSMAKPHERALAGLERIEKHE